MKIKRFVVFAGSCYYPLGGVDDKKGDFDTMEEAEKAILDLPHRTYGWQQIWDLETGEEFER